MFINSESLKKKPEVSKPTERDLSYSNDLRDAMHLSPYLKAMVDFGDNYPNIVLALVHRIPKDLR